MNTHASTDTEISIRTRNGLAQRVRRLAAVGLVAVVGSGAVAGVVAADEHIAVIGDPITGEVDDDPNHLESEIEELQAYLTPRAATKVTPKLPKPTIAPHPQMTIPAPPKPTLTPHPEMTIPWPVPGSENIPEQVPPEKPADAPQAPGQPNGPADTPQGPGEQPIGSGSGPVGVAVESDQVPGSATGGASDAATTVDNTAPGSAPAGTEISPEGAQGSASGEAAEASARGDAAQVGSFALLTAGLLAGGGLLAGVALGLLGRRRATAISDSDGQSNSALTYTS